MFSRIIRSISFIPRFHQHNNFSTKKIKFTFINKDNSQTPVEAEIGKSLLEVAHDNNVDLEGACESSLACSTCHVYIDSEVFKTLKPAGEEEEDLLDLAFGVTETSRLGCQVKVSEIFEGKTVKLPKATRNMYVDGAKPSKH